MNTSEYFSDVMVRMHVGNYMLIILFLHPTSIFFKHDINLFLFDQIEKVKYPKYGILKRLLLIIAVLHFCCVRE